AQDMAVRAPERVASLALLCTFARGRSALSFRPADLWLNLRTAVGTAEMRRRAFYELVADPALPADEGRIAALEEAFGRPLHALPPAATSQLMALTRADLREGLADVRVPALVMSATHDRLAPPAQGRELAEILGVPFVEVPGGHAVPVQDAPRVNGLLREHLERAS
ncbi:MAG: alpha/beta hydrolase, partial [Myxococcales bacterium]|nr:alpha/beta hydrolase [Myxococcales bacterium]